MKTPRVLVKAGLIAAVTFILVLTTLRADTNQLQLVPPELVPTAGTFYTVQNPEGPPLPFNPFPELSVYSLGDEFAGPFLIDDGSFDYEAWLQQQAAMQAEETEEGGDIQTLDALFSPGCAFGLSISVSNEVGELTLTLHNTREGQTYTVWSLEGDLTQTNWMVETNITGAAGTLTETIIAMNQRTNLFLKASEERDYVINTVFLGLNFTNSSQLAPDSMGAVGLYHFVEVLNGGMTNASIAVYDKSGALISQSSPSNFFAVFADDTNYPTGSMADQRILFDHHSQRWVASTMQSSAGVVILAVSNDESPTNLVSGWTKHLIRIGNGLGGIDFPTLGLDDNGIYLAIMRIPGGQVEHTIVAVKKPEIYQGTNFSTRIDVTNDLNSWTIQPAVNFDEVATNGLAWFVAKGPFDAGTNYQGGAIFYRRLQWQGTNAAWADTNWITISDSGADYQDYYELGGTNFNTLPSTGISAPQNATTNGINLYSIGSRLTMAVVRNEYLWTCHAIGLSGTNGSYDGDVSGTNVDRSAVQWFKLEIGPEGGGLALSDHGRVFDSAATNAGWYHFPSLAVNCAGDMVAGFSGSSTTNFVGAFYTWRMADGLMPHQPRLIQAGTTNFLFVRWGDYSATTSDPADDWNFWTVQEYATPLPNQQGIVLGRWGTVIAKTRPDP